MLADGCHSWALQLGAVYVGTRQKGIEHIAWTRSTQLRSPVTSVCVEQQQFIRVHTNPKRYTTACNETIWPQVCQRFAQCSACATRLGTVFSLLLATLPASHPLPQVCFCHGLQRVVHLDDDYLVLSKPADLPCMRHESNAAEELAACAGRALGMPELEVSVSLRVLIGV